MGRYYSGDIEGKFWFAVQSSDDADFFGVIGEEPGFLVYGFDESNLGSINDGIGKCRDALGNDKSKLDTFFASQKPWNEEIISDATKIPIETIPDLLEWYARLELGEKILKCVNEKGRCEFQAEL